MIESDSTPSVDESSASVATAPSTPSPEASSVGAEVDAMFGYRAPSSASSESTEPDDEATGAPPAPSSETSNATSTTDQPIAGAPPADQAQSTSTPEAPAPTDDPLKDATSLAYTVNGESRTDDRIKVVKDLGAFINPQDVPYLQQRLSERDHLHETSRANYEKLSTLEALTSWPQRDAQNKIVGTLTGREAIEAARIDYGNALARLEAYDSLFADPARLASFLTVDQEKGEWGINAEARAQLALAIENRQLKLTPAIRQHLASLGTPKPATPTPGTPGTPGGAEAGRPSVDAAAVVTVAMQQGAITGLTPADQTWAASIAPRYVRTATAEDVRQVPTLTLGEPILEPEFLDVLRDRAALRADAAKQVTAASTAAANNAPKLAAALAGRHQAPRSVTPTPRPAVRGDDALTPEEEAFARFERAGAAALRARSA